MTMRTVVADSPLEVPVSWQKLAGHAFYGSIAWHRYQQEDPETRARFIQVLDGDEPVAQSAVYLVDREENARYRPLDASGERGAVRSGPTVLVGNRRGYCNRLDLIADARAVPASAAMVAAVHEIAQDHGAAVAWWMYLTEADVGVLARTGRAGPPWLVAADASIPLPGSSFADYLASLSRNQRRQVIRDRRTFAASGQRVVRAPLAARVRELAPLLAAHQQRHGHQATAAEIEDLLRRQTATVGDAGQAYLATGRHPAGTVTFETEDEIVARAFGSEIDPAFASGLYFETTYYAPIERAYQIGAGSLHLGIGTLRAKVRRGARVQLRWTVATTDGDPPRPAPGRNRATWQSISDQLDTVTALLPASLEAVGLLEEDAQ